MKLTTSFGQIKILSTNIAEIIINEGIEISLEMVEEYDTLMAKNFNGNYAVLVNRINHYSYAYEALISVGSAQHLIAVAAIDYGEISDQRSREIKSVRQMDNLNIKEFSGLELGRASAINWLNEQLENVANNAKISQQWR